MSERGASDQAGFIHAHWRTILMVIVAALGAGVLTALIIITGDATRERDRALTAQSRSYEVMILTRTVAGTIARAEATLGRFVISGDKAIGNQFSDQWVTAGQQIDRLDTLTGDNPPQQRRVDALRTAYRERGDELTLIALSTRYKKNEQALARYYQARESPALTRIGLLFDGFISNERNLLAERSATARQSIAWSNRWAKILAAFGALIVIGAIALGWMTVRALAARAIADADAEAERERAGELEAAVAAATHDLQVEMREREAAEAQLRQVQKLDAVGQLTGGIAHDFNNMLAVVIGGIELAKRRHSEGSPDVRRHLDSAAEGASRASALTRRLLSFARSEPLLPEAVEARGLVAGMSDLLDRTLSDAIEVDVSDDGTGWHIWVDRYGLENAILNLAVNARDAMDGRGVLRIATGGATLAEEEVGRCVAGDYVTIAVTDTGCGMAPEVIDRVFEPFFTTKEVGKGTGLGLSQIFGFVQQSGGEITIVSAPGEGCTVTLYLPRGAARPMPVSAEPATLRDARSSAADALDILVIEDDPRVLAATMDVLRELGHRPIACDDPLKAGEIAAAMPVIDLVISDVLMPGKTGPELVTELRPAIPDAAVLFVTGFAGDAAEHGEFGGQTVLRKPFTILALADAIAAAMTLRDDRPPERVAARR